MKGPLEGIRVVDLGHYIAGPLTTMLLADQGADVIRIDPPGGPRFSHSANLVWNRGKRRIVLDLKQPADREIGRRLTETCDVVVENSRPGVLERLGLGAAAVRRANERLVYCSLPGFAPDDPRVATPAFEGIVGAATALYSIGAGTAAAACLHRLPHPIDLRRPLRCDEHRDGAAGPRARRPRPGDRRPLARRRLRAAARGGARLRSHGALSGARQRHGSVLAARGCLSLPGPVRSAATAASSI